MQIKNILTAGQPLQPAGKVLLMLHGRGASAQDILSLSQYLDVEGFTLLAPQALNHSWYPYSFLVPTAQNEPALSSALNGLKDLVGELGSKGIPPANIYFLGFSQGACLTLEFVARNAQRWGGVVAFTGGLIGDKINQELYKGDFRQTPVFIGTSNPDMHVPVERVQATTRILRDMQASVTEKVYNGMGHTVSQDEIDLANQLVFRATPAPSSQIRSL